MRLSTRTRRRLAIAVFAAYLLLLLDMTIRWLPVHHPPVNLVPFRTIADDLTDGGKGFIVNFVGNVVAFVPVGAVPAWLWPRWARFGRVVLLGLAFSASIELTQYLTARRVADVDDLILNTAGAALGWQIVQRVTRRNDPI